MGEKARPDDYPEGIIPGQEKWVTTLYDGLESAAIHEEGETPHYAARWAGGVHMTCYGETREEAVKHLIEMTPALLAQLVDIRQRVDPTDPTEESDECRDG